MSILFEILNTMRFFVNVVVRDKDIFVPLLSSNKVISVGCF